MKKRLILFILAVSIMATQFAGYSFAQDRIDFLIVVTDGLKSTLEPLALHRTEQGLSVKIIEISEINLEPSIGISKNLWNYLDNNHKKWGLSHLLIVADYKNIPQAKLHSANGIKIKRDTEPGLVYSDIYYSILGQDWDKNENGLLGEPIDNVDIDPQISVGRIPFSNKSIVENWVKNNIGYDESKFRKNTLQIGAIYSFDREDGDLTNFYTDGATMHNSIWDEILSKNNFSRTRIFENDSLGIKNTITTDKSLNRANILTALSENEYGMVNFLAHGTESNVIRKRWTKDINKNGRADSVTQTGEKEILKETLFSANLISAIDIDCGVVIGTACSTAYVATEIDSLATSFLRSGASAYIGGTALNYFIPDWSSKEDGGNQTISYELTRYYSEGSTLGWSLMSTLRDYYNNFSNISKLDYTLQNIYSFNLLGDPTMKLNPPQSVKNMSLHIKPHSIKITSGETAYITIETEKIESTNSINFEITSAVNGISFSFSKDNPIPGEIFSLKIETSITVNPGDYDFTIKADVDEYQGSSTLHLKIIPPPESTVIQLEPDYTLAKKDQEFWLDLIVQPTKPIDSMAGLLSYNSEMFEYVGYRIGSIVSEDYRCLLSINVENKPVHSNISELNFSFERGVENYGITATGVVFSFCFKGISNTKKGSKRFAVTSLSIESNQDDNRRAHSFTSLPHSLVNIYDGENEQTGYFINTNISYNFNYTADLSTPDNKLTLSGTVTTGTLFFINNFPVAVDSEGNFEYQLSLEKRITDIRFLLKDEFDRFLLIKRRVEYSSLLELAFHNSEKPAWSNGECHILETVPYIKNGRTLVPIRFIAEEQLGFKVSWDANEKRIDLHKDSTHIQMWIGNTNAKLNGEALKIDVPPEISNSRTFVPLRFISEALGCEVSWISKSKTALIIYVNENP